MTGCGGHIGAQHEELLSGLRPGNQNEWAGNKTNPSWHRLLSSLETHMATEGSLYEGEYSSYGTVHMTASWHCSFITTQMDSDESGGFLLVIVVTNTRPRPRPPGGLLSWDIRPAD